MTKKVRIQAKYDRSLDTLRFLNHGGIKTKSGIMLGLGETEKEVIDSILSMKGKVTMIIIAHRLNTVKNCDFIYKLEGGEIIESGVPDNIL